MGLTIEQIKELVKDRPHKKEIDRGRVHQNRLRFHTETEITKAELSPYYSEFIGWICTEQPELLPKDKVARFKQLLTCPLSTIQLTESISINLLTVMILKAMKRRKTGRIIKTLSSGRQKAFRR
jgi:hypothetical protein